MPNEVIYCKKDEVTDIFNNEINNEIKRRKISYSSGIFTPNRLTECDRRLLYKANGENIEENKFIENFLLEQDEKCLKNKWINFFENSIKTKIIGKNLIASDCNYNITGEIDCIIKKGNTEFVVLIKRHDGAPRRKYIVELMTYLWLVEKTHGLLICDSNNIFNLYHIKISIPIIVAITNKCKKIIEKKMKGELPERQYESPCSYECLECEFNAKCWK